MLNNRVRRIDPNNNVTTVASGFVRPTAVAVDLVTGELYVADSGTHTIRVIGTNSVVRRLAGSGTALSSGNRDSLLATNALFNDPRGLLWVGGNTGLLVSDTGNRSLRRIYYNTNLLLSSVETFFSSPTGLKSPISMASDQDGNIALTDLVNNSFVKIQVTAPQAPVRDPLVGIVILTNNVFGQLVTKLTPITNSTFNNDIKVAILPTDNNVATFFTLDPNVDLANNPAGGSARQQRA